MKCPNCGKDVLSISGRVVGNKLLYSCEHCSRNYQRKSLPAILGCDNFNPHYDAQLDTFFVSREHKDMVLKQRGLTQVSGTASPRHTEGKGRVVCSEGQYRRNLDKL